MKPQHFLLAITLLLSSFGALCSESPALVVERFYTLAIHATPGSASALEGGLSRARPLLGQKLFAALEAQRAYEEACARLVPGGDLKPHMLDQSPFFDAPDTVHSLESTSAVVKGDTARVFARLAYSDGYGWTDTVVLRREDDHWVIVNIEWQDGGSLTKRLLKFAGYRCGPQPPTSQARSQNAPGHARRRV